MPLSSRSKAALAAAALVATGAAGIGYFTISGDEARSRAQKQTSGSESEHAQDPAAPARELSEPSSDTPARARGSLTRLYADENEPAASSASAANESGGYDAGRRGKRPRPSDEELEAAGMTPVGLYSGKHSPRWTYLRELLKSQGRSAEAKALEPLLDDMRAAGVPYAKPNVAAMLNAELAQIRAIRQSGANLSVGSKVFGTLDDVLFELEFEATNMQNGEGPSVDQKLEQEVDDDNHRDKDLPEPTAADGAPDDDLGEPAKASERGKQTGTTP